jgi:hypothetical protein
MTVTERMNATFQAVALEPIRYADGSAPELPTDRKDDSDIVNWLCRVATQPELLLLNGQMVNCSPHMLTEAADEIQRLRGELTNLRITVGDVMDAGVLGGDAWSRALRETFNRLNDDLTDRET